MLKTALPAAATPILSLKERRDGRTEWRWQIPPCNDPLQSTFANFRTVKLGWHDEKGRCVLATRKVRCGELLFTVPAIAITLFKSGAPDRQDSHELDAFGLDDATVALSLATLATPAGRSLAKGLGIGAHRAASTALHVAMRVREQHQDALPHDIASLSDAELGSLCLRVKSNLHLCHDDETAARAIGVGLYPAAAMCNHACSPNACFSWSGDGKEMHVRALADISHGQEVTVSYLAEEQLYAPWEERQSLLREAFGYEPAHCPERQRSEAATVAHGTLSEALRERAQTVLGNARRALAMPSVGAGGGGGTGAGAGAGDASRDGARSDALAGALTELRALIASELQGTLHPFHWLVQEAQAALLALARTSEIDEPPLVAQSALHLIAAREATLPLGTLHLAALYTAHGSALCKLLGSGSLSDADERKQVAAAAVKSLKASQAIRATCLGEGHPLTKATGAALRHAREALS